MKLSEKITELRKANGMTQEELASICNVSRQSISKWEADIALPETEKLLILGETFQVSMDKRDFPERISKVMRSDSDTNGNWFVDFKAGNEKYIVFKDRILKYRIGNQDEKESVCNECRKLGISNEQMNWPE